MLFLVKNSLCSYPDLLSPCATVDSSCLLPAYLLTCLPANLLVLPVGVLSSRCLPACRCSGAPRSQPWAYHRATRSPAKRRPRSTHGAAIAWRTPKKGASLTGHRHLTSRSQGFSSASLLPPAIYSPCHKWILTLNWLPTVWVVRLGLISVVAVTPLFKYAVNVMTATELVFQRIHLRDKMKTPSTDEDCVIYLKSGNRPACGCTLSLN